MSSGVLELSQLFLGVVYGCISGVSPGLLRVSWNDVGVVLGYIGGVKGVFKCLLAVSGVSFGYLRGILGISWGSPMGVLRLSFGCLWRVSWLSKGLPRILRAVFKLLESCIWVVLLILYVYGTRVQYPQHCVTVE